jgi:hypothetical protein
MHGRRQRLHLSELFDFRSECGVLVLLLCDSKWHLRKRKLLRLLYYHARELLLSWVSTVQHRQKRWRIMVCERENLCLHESSRRRAMPVHLTDMPFIQVLLGPRARALMVLCSFCLGTALSLVLPHSAVSRPAVAVAIVLAAFSGVASLASP